MYDEDGCTLTDWEHWASSEPLAAPARAYEPEWTGLVVTPSVAEQVQPDRVPVSKPGLVSRLVAAEAGPAVSAKPQISSAAAGTPRSLSGRECFMRTPGTGEPVHPKLIRNFLIR